jgi:hypothetical protein
MMCCWRPSRAFLASPKQLTAFAPVSPTITRCPLVPEGFISPQASSIPLMPVSLDSETLTNSQTQTRIPLDKFQFG